MSFFHSKPQRFLAFVVLLVLVPRQSPAEEVDFERDIVPILEEHCWHCHGEDEQESDLRLDLRVKMLKGGNSGLSAVVPGKPEKSYLIEVINHVDEDMAMPPDEDKIPAEEIELLTRWIKEGANWPGQMDALDDEGFDHWSFQPVVRPEVPIVAFRSANDAPDGTQLSPRLRRSSRRRLSARSPGTGGSVFLGTRRSTLADSPRVDRADRDRTDSGRNR